MGRPAIEIMHFMKNNCGKTLPHAAEEWHHLQLQKSNANYKSEIPPSNQYNQYIRDFFTDNPNLTMNESRLCWKRQRSLPLVRHVYERSDLDKV